MTSFPSHTRFQLVLRVEAADIDEPGHVNNIVYLRRVQEMIPPLQSLTPKNHSQIRGVAPGYYIRASAAGLRSECRPDVELTLG